MEIRYYIDPETGEPHLYRHQVVEGEVEDVLGRPQEDRPGFEGSRVAMGQTREGRYLRVIYVPDLAPGSIFPGTASATPEKAMSQSKLPADWNEDKIRQVLDHYESQTDQQGAAEDEEAWASTTHTTMDVPVDLVQKVRDLIGKREAS